MLLVHLKYPMCCSLSCGSCYVLKVPVDCVMCCRFLWIVLYVVDSCGLCYVVGSCGLCYVL